MPYCLGKAYIPYTLGNIPLTNGYIKTGDRMAEQIKVPDVLPKKAYLKLPPEERELYVREVLRQTLSMNQYGVTVGAITRQLPFDSRTVEKHLSVLTYTNEIYGVKIGPTRLYLPNTKAMHSVIEKTLLLNGKEYSVHLLQNRLGKFIFIQEKKKRRYTQDVSGGILIPFSGFAQFVDYLQQILAHLRETGEDV